MSLEKAIAENTAAVRELIAALGKVSIPSATVELTTLTPAIAPQAEVATAKKPTPAEKEEPVSSPRTVAEATADAAPEQKAESTQKSPAPVSDDTAPAVTLDTLIDQAKKLAAAKTRNALVAVLEAFGMARISEAKPEQYPALSVALQKALEE